MRPATNDTDFHEHQTSAIINYIYTHHSSVFVSRVFSMRCVDGVSGISDIAQERAYHLASSLGSAGASHMEHAIDNNDNQNNHNLFIVGNTLIRRNTYIFILYAYVCMDIYK